MSDERPPAREPAAPSWWARAAGVALLAAMAVIVVVTVASDPWSLAGIAGIFAITFLRLRFPLVRRLGAVLGRGYLRLTYWLVVAFLPLAGIRAIADVVADVPLLVAVALLLVWLAVYLLLVRLVSSEERRRALWLRLRGVDRVTPFLYAFVLGFAAIVLFATLAFILSDREVIRFGTDPATAAKIAQPADALDFFSWHMLDAIPALDVTKTLRWEEPLGYTDSGVGALLLAFKILVIVPIVAAFASFWRYSREPDPSPAVPSVNPG